MLDLHPAYKFTCIYSFGMKVCVYLKIQIQARIKKVHAQRILVGGANLILKMKIFNSIGLILSYRNLNKHKHVALNHQEICLFIPAINLENLSKIKENILKTSK